MKRLIIFVFFFAILFLNAQEINGSLNIIMFDVSGSMVGKGDGRGINIFSDVKKAIHYVVENVTEESYVVILPFHRDLDKKLIKEFYVKDEYTRDEIIKYINSLEAFGKQTWLTRSYLSTLKYVENIIQRENLGKEKLISILIFTDGRGNGPEDNDIENFIRAFKLKRNDYPYLYTKFITTQDVFNPAEKETLENNGINVADFKREDFHPLKMSISPQVIDVYHFNPRFEIEITSEKGLIGSTVMLGLRSPNGELGKLFRLNPEEVTIDAMHSRYVINVELAGKSDPLRLVQQYGRTIKGELKVFCSNDKAVILPQNIIPFSYNFNKLKIRIKKEKVDTLLNGGKLLVKLENYLSIPVETALEIESSFAPVEMKAKKNPINIRKNKFVTYIEPKNPKEFKRYRWSLKNNKVFTYKLKLNSHNPDCYFEPDYILFCINFTPSKLKKVLPLLMVLIPLMLIGLIVFIVLNSKTAVFPDNAILYLPDGSSAFLKTRLGKSWISVGGDGSGADATFSGGPNSVLFYISPGMGTDILVKQLDKNVELYSPAGNREAEFTVASGEKFFVVEPSTGDKYEFEYNV